MKELLEYVAYLNVRSRMWVNEDPENRWSSEMPEEAEHYAGRGIFSVEDYELESMRTNFWELYKEVNGVRPRWMPVWEMSAEELEPEIARLERQAEVVFEEERLYEEHCVAKFEEQVASVIELGAGSREVALDWIRDSYSEADMMYGDEYIEFELGIPYGYMKGELRYA